MTVNTQELRELVEKATPGPWTWKQIGSYSTPGVALFWSDTSKGGVHCRRLDSNGGLTEADADLITNAVRALPALLDEIDALRAELQARQWISTSDQMPRENDLVLACHIDGDIEIVFGHLLHETKQDGAYSHWQPLPPAPPQGETA